MVATLEQSPTTSWYPRRTVDENGHNPRLRWTRADVHDLVRLGKLPEDGWELLEGEIILKVGKNQPHVYVTQEVAEWLEGVYGRKYVTTESPIRAGVNNEPEPDISVTKRPRKEYLLEGDAPDATTEVHLAVEVTDSTVYQDQQVKARLYATFEIPEYWIVDVNKREIRVHRNPVNGVYQDIDDLEESKTVIPFTAPAGTSPKLISDLLP